MSPIFASPDMATLVANFDPLSVSDGRPALVRSRSGDSLVNLSRLVARFTKILETSHSRIDKSNLATLLGVQDGVEQWLYEGVSTPLRESKDHRQFIPVPEARVIVDRFLSQAQIACIDIDIFATQADIDIDSLQNIISRSSSDGLRKIPAANTTFFYSDQVAENIKAELRDAIGAAGSDICDLPEALFEEIPTPVLNELAKDVAAELDGEIRLEGDHAVYIPANYSAAVDERLKQMRDGRIKDLVRQLDNQGYCMIEQDDLTTSAKSNGTNDDNETFDELVLAVFQQQRPEDDRPLEVLISDDMKNKYQEQSKVLVMPETLREGTDRLRSLVIMHLENLFQSKERTASLKPFTQSLQRGNFSMLNLDEFSQLLSHSHYVKDVVSNALKRLEELESEENEHFVQLIEARLLIPLQLYTSGTETVKDTTLKQHLEDFVMDHFRREVIPQTIKAANEHHYLRERERERQLEKLKQTSVEAKTFATFQSAVTKFARKLKIDTPVGGMVRRVKYRTLEAAAKSIRLMTRGSDVLQNAIWILLAQSSSGLFMSSGKDTSRMIKQYELVGDAIMAKRLVVWRDMLKAGQETKDDLQAMRDAAKEAVEMMQRERRKSSSVTSGRRLSSLSGVSSPGTVVRERKSSMKSNEPS